jgi:hypothetical protein
MYNNQFRASYPTSNIFMDFFFSLPLAEKMKFTEKLIMPKYLYYLIFIEYPCSQYMLRVNNVNIEACQRGKKMEAGPAFLSELSCKEIEASTHNSC